MLRLQNNEITRFLKIQYFPIAANIRSRMDQKYNSPGIYACGGAESNPRLWKWGVMACDVIVEKVEGGEKQGPPRNGHHTGATNVGMRGGEMRSEVDRLRKTRFRPCACTCVCARRRFNKAGFNPGKGGKGDENESIGV